MMWVAAIASIVASSCLGLWLHLRAAEAVETSDLETYAHLARLRARATDDPAHSFSETRLDGRTIAVEQHSDHEGGVITTTRVFDSSGKLIFDPVRNLVFHLAWTNILGLAIAIGLVVDFQSGRAPLAASAPAPQVSAEALAGACQWRDKVATPQPARTPDRWRRDYWPNGAERSVEPVVGGALEGVGHYTYANGALYGDIPWRNDRKHGVFTLFREDGSREMTLAYRDGDVYGLNEWFGPDGKLQQAWVYLADGQIVSPDLCAPRRG